MIKTESEQIDITYALSKLDPIDHVPVEIWRTLQRKRGAIAPHFRCSSFYAAST